MIHAGNFTVRADEKGPLTEMYKLYSHTVVFVFIVGGFYSQAREKSVLTTEIPVLHFQRLTYDIFHIVKYMSQIHRPK